MRRSTVKYKEKHSTKQGCVSQPVPKHLRTDADVQQRQYELKHGEVIKTVPKIEFNQTLRSSNTCPEDREGLSQRRRLHDDSQLSSTKTA